MAVKAVHIEVVSDLTTSAFLASLQRFIPIPLEIYSDCGTNFQGAASELRRLWSDPEAQNSVSNAVPCRWHFNPPAAPHFGGLWEAAVKSMKTHLKRVIGTQLLTFEEMCTITQRIEAILNSRPITPLSSDPNDLRVLTPGHFLTDAPLVTLPDPDVTQIPMNRLNLQLLDQFHQSLWKRWSSEYLRLLQVRSKWHHPQPNVTLGDLVLVQAPNLPPTLWKMGRVEAVHPGEDGVVRVVTLRTSDGTLKRPVVKLARLPIN
ncbi:unnamed protein product [Macrosiphum euphorbiae]|uniref:DUF5641 domain-containing protein n=2 Tax=Macrosiphum euphorbiae TaxID=13131 RepID=A0AAV0Y1N6_9HEMI|nr:unnamed protein product [Macrosiphum euphorbiae]